jgi:phage terminase large subunit GpA-like protein
VSARDEVDLALVDGGAIVRAIWAEYLRPAEVLTVTEWAEANRVLSAKDSSEAGPYRVRRTPYAQEPQDCLSAHSGVDEVVLIWGAQTSKTTIGMNWIGYLVDSNPGPVMLVQPTLNLAKRFSRQRLSPMVAESPALRGKVTQNRSRGSANTTLMKDFPGGLMVIAGANSAADLRSMPVRDLFLDEIDGYPADVDGEGDPCQLAEARQTTFARRKRLKTSTPTTKDSSRIEAGYLASDRCRYLVPCPHCGELQPLDWGADQPHGLKWTRDPDTGTVLPGSVRYVCARNGCEIQEHHKPAMLAGGRWVAAAPGAQGGRVRGFQLSSLYSPLGWLSWSELAQEWIEAMESRRAGDVSLLRVFINTRLAETYEEQGDRADAHQLARRAEDYRLATVPWGGLICTGAVDVQGDRLEATAFAWGRGEEAWVIDHQAWYGDPSIPEGQPSSLWDHVTTWRRQPLLHAGGAHLRLRACAIDTGGHHTQVVYSYARRHGADNVLAIKGSSQAGRPILGKPTEIEINHHGQRLKRGVRLWPIGTDTAKALLYARLRIEQTGPGFVHFSRQLSGAYFEQLTAERLVTRYLKGRPKLEWVKPASKRNEALDLGVYNIAAAYFLGVHRFTEAHWQKFEAAVRQADLLQVEASTSSPSEPPAPIITPAQPTEPEPTQATAAPPGPSPRPAQPDAPAAPRPKPRAAPPPRRKGFATKW